jgi:hypothetical protein
MSSLSKVLKKCLNQPSVRLPRMISGSALRARLRLQAVQSLALWLADYPEEHNLHELRSALQRKFNITGEKSEMGKA